MVAGIGTVESISCVGDFLPWIIPYHRELSACRRLQGTLWVVCRRVIQTVIWQMPLFAHRYPGACKSGNLRANMEVFS